MNKDILYKYFSHQTTPQESAYVRSWVDESSENLKEFMAERALFDAITLLDNSTIHTKQNPAKRILLSASKVAAIAIITLAISFVVRHIWFPTEIPMQEISVPIGQQLNITLTDGTNIWLNSNTKLKYPALFNGKERNVEIDGEGYFRVAKNAHMPFKVKTTEGEIEVLGTTFNIESYSSEKNFNAALLEGSIKITRDNKKYGLTPGQAAKIGQNGELLITHIDDYDAFRWTEGIISLKNDSFDMIMKKFEKYYGIDISIERPDLKEIAYSGKFYLSDGIEYALKVLQHDINFKFNRDQENHIIHIK